MIDLTKLTVADLNIVEYQKTERTPTDKVFVPFCRIMPQFRKPMKQYEHVEISAEYYERLKKGL